MCFSFAACGGEDSTPTYVINTNPPAPSSDQNQVADGSWAIYWYLCGSDLETNYGCATNDLVEMLEVQLPENVTVVIQTGGAAVWQNDQMDPNKLQRWLFNSEGLQLIDEQETTNMGDAQTLIMVLIMGTLALCLVPCSMVSGKIGEGAYKTYSFTVTLDHPEISRRARQTRPIFIPDGFFEPLLVNYVNQSVTVAYNPITDTLVVIG